MAQDIRKMMQDQSLETTQLPSGHEERFENKLKNASRKKEQPQNNSFFWLKIAAAVIAIFGVAYFGLKQYNGVETLGTEIVEVEEQTKEDATQLTIGDLSPDLKKIEDFYINGINVQLASLKINDGNKDLIEGYMKRLKELDVEYQRLTKELNEVGPTEATITALIDNLKLRMDLLFKLKNKLKELKELENEQIQIS